MKKKTIIETTDLTKKYGDVTAVRKLNLSVEEGETFGLLGPNGCGKTTTVLMLMGFTDPTSGSISMSGFDPAKFPLETRRITGYLPERVEPYRDLTAKKNLKYIARLNKIPHQGVRDRIEKELKRVDLDGYGDVKVKTFSLGMKQRLGIASVLIKNPKIVLLDEPTIGLDIDSTQRILRIISNLSKKKKVTILLCSHHLDQVRQVCNRVGIMSKGRMTTQDTVKNLEREISMVVKAEVSSTPTHLLRKISDIPGVEDVKKQDGSLLVKCKEDLRSEIGKVIFESGVSLLGLERERLDLQKVYRKYSVGG